MRFFLRLSPCFSSTIYSQQDISNHWPPHIAMSSPEGRIHRLGKYTDALLLCQLLSAKSALAERTTVNSVETAELGCHKALHTLSTDIKLGEYFVAVVFVLHLGALVAQSNLCADNPKGYACTDTNTTLNVPPVIGIAVLIFIFQLPGLGRHSSFTDFHYKSAYLPCQ